MQDAGIGDQFDTGSLGCLDRRPVLATISPAGTFCSNPSITKWPSFPDAPVTTIMMTS
jgi:hypothetical protein